MSAQIVVAFRMPPGSMRPGPEGGYLTRARSMCARGEALGGRLVAWSAAVFAVAWDLESLEEALLLATSIQEEASAPERAWACGLAEGELDELSPEGARMHLAWGEALLSAASLARVARPGEVLVDGDVRALRAGQLALLGARAATDAGQRIRGWKLDVARPWKGQGPPSSRSADATDRFVLPPPRPAAASASAHAGKMQEMTGLDFSSDELSTSEVLQIVEASASSPAPRRKGLADRLRSLVPGFGAGDQGLADLRRNRAAVESGSSAARCQASLALAMALTLAGRPEEALLEALDALARGREADDARAVGACMALLAKLYAAAGRGGEAAALREAAGVR